MKEIIDAKTRDALAYYGDAAVKEFYVRLAKHQLCATHCDACDQTAFPPRTFCPTCFAEDVSWRELPKSGTLYAFTQQHRPMRFPAPDVIGLVKLEGVGKILTRIDASFESLEIGQVVEVDFLEVADGFVVHQFRPVNP